MRLEDLADLVRRMRAAQRLYFRERHPAALEESRRLEREVDAALARLDEDDQPGLFDRLAAERLEGEGLDL